MTAEFKKSMRDKLYNMLHRQEIARQENEYDIVKATRKLGDLRELRNEYDEGIATIKEMIEAIEADEK